VRWPDFLDRTHTDALLVLHRGSIVFEEYRNGMAAETPHMLFSVTKSILGLIAELLAAQGAIDLSLPASAYVPELRGTMFGAAALRDLLDMRDGAPFDETYADPGAAIHLYSAAYWGAQAGGVRRPLARMAAGEGVPGRFAYRTPVTDVVGWAVANATGTGLAELVSELLWQPIGAEADAFFVLDTGGHEIAAAGLNATARDVGRLALMLLQRGRVGERQVVPERIVERLFQGGDRAAFAASGQHPTRPGWSYRSHWWVRHEPRSALAALGVFGQRVHIDPSDDLAVVRFGSHPVASNSETDLVHEQAFAAVAALLRPEREQ
jgi:CubicO group peptidase (beta-lactamase class C family)